MRVITLIKRLLSSRKRYLAFCQNCGATIEKYYSGTDIASAGTATVICGFCHHCKCISLLDSKWTVK